MLVARRKSDRAIYPDFQSAAAPGVLSAAAVANGFATADDIEEINVDQATFDGYVQAAYGAQQAAASQLRATQRAAIAALAQSIVGVPLSQLTAAQTRIYLICVAWDVDPGSITLDGNNNPVVAPLANWLAN